MNEDFVRIENGQLQPVATELEVFEIPFSEEMRTAAIANGLPPRLWLGILRNKEYPPGYRHAWGHAWVSSTQNGSSPYAVATLRFRIDMPEPTGTNVSDQTCHNCSSRDGDCKFYGAVLGDFQSNWAAWASDPNYGSWSVSGAW
jgi:hypothetical protein